MKNILIIEDDPKIAAALDIRFRAGGYATLTATDAITGLSKAVQGQPDLIVLDISLPGGNGLELAEKLQRLPETRNTPFLFVTASKDPALREKVMNLRAAGLLEKPYDPEELLAVAGHALGETHLFSRQCHEKSMREESKRGANPGPRKILIVEDDRKIAMALAIRLKAAGFSTFLAHDALAGVSTAIAHQPDLVLLDISMPAGDGFTVAERVQALLAAPPPIIFLTASKQPGFREKAQELHAAGFFEKPYEAEDLIGAVHETLKM